MRRSGATHSIVPMPRRDAATRSPTSMLSTLGFVGGSKVRLLVPTTNCETTAPVLPRFRVNPQALPVTPDHVSVQGTRFDTSQKRSFDFNDDVHSGLTIQMIVFVFFSHSCRGRQNATLKPLSGCPRSLAPVLRLELGLAFVSSDCRARLDGLLHRGPIPE